MVVVVEAVEAGRGGGAKLVSHPVQTSLDHNRKCIFFRKSDPEGHDPPKTTTSLGFPHKIFSIPLFACPVELKDDVE